MIKMFRPNRNIRRKALIHKIFWGTLVVITVIVVACDVGLFFQDRAEKKRAATQQTRVIHKKAQKSKSTLKITHRPKRQHWPQDKQSRESNHYQKQAKQAVNGTGVNPQIKQKLLMAFNGLQPNQQKRVLEIINSGMSNQAKMAAIKSYVMGN